MNTGKETIVAGSGKKGYKDGERDDAEFNLSCFSAIAVDQTTGFLYLSDSCNHVIRVINPQSRSKEEYREERQREPKV
jgi:hypothetical protein